VHLLLLVLFLLIADNDLRLRRGIVLHLNPFFAFRAADSGINDYDVRVVLLLILHRVLNFLYSYLALRLLPVRNVYLVD
jgi:hypothetical protein